MPRMHLNPLPFFLEDQLLTSLSLLPDIVLGPALLRLASIVLVLILSLLGTIARQARSGASHRSTDAVADPRGIVLELATGLLLLPGQVLLAAGLLQALCRENC